MEINININVNEAIRYMGYREQPPAPQMEMIESCRRELVKAITPAWVYRAFDIEECDDGIKLAGTKLIFKGEDIRRHLSGCRRCILLCATASSKADELIRRKEAEDITLGYMTDCLASAAVEAVCDEAEKEIYEKLTGCWFTWRFSPGYGDFPLDIQPMIIETLNAQKRAG